MIRWIRWSLLCLVLMRAVASAQCPPAPCTTSPCTFCVSAWTSDETAYGVGNSFPPPAHDPAEGFPADTPIISFTHYYDTSVPTLPPYGQSYLLLHWSTSFPAGATLTDAHMVWAVNSITNQENRNVICDWHPWTPGNVLPSDYSATYPTSDALGSDPVTNFTASADNSVPHVGSLSGLENIAVNGETYIRCTIDGGTPTGINIVRVSTYANNAATAPRLMVSFTIGTPTPPTATPIPTATRTPTSNTTPTGVITKTPKSCRFPNPQP